MSHVKSGGSTKNLRDSKPKFLGIKLADGQEANAGSIIVRQRGTKILAGKNTRLGRDHTIYAEKAGKVRFSSKRKTGFDGQTRRAKVANIDLK